MIETLEIDILKTPQSRLEQVNFQNLPFGKVFSDHMFLVEYKNGHWQKPIIRSFEDLKLSPAMSALHYGQSIFEGMKAFRADDERILIFRPEQNWERMNASARRLCMPELPKDLFIEGIRQLVNVDRNWVPSEPESSLYIRPFMFATDPFLGVKPSESYLFVIITSPVGPYYGKPLHLKIETHYTRAALGGVGAAKAAGNYASAMLPAQQAQAKGIDQLIWTDAKEHQYLEEAGTMNMMVVIDDVLITPPLTSTILPGITRDSFLTLAKDAGVAVEERRIHVNEVVDAAQSGRLKELFGVGTAATTAQVVKLTYEDMSFDLPPIEERTVSNTIGSQLINIKKGLAEDPYGWNISV